VAVLDAPADDRVTSSARSRIDCGILPREIATAAGGIFGLVITVRLNRAGAGGRWAGR